MAFYINLDYREDRRKKFEKECAKMKLHVERFPGITGELTPSHGCTRSHIEVLKIARARGLPSVLIFEDDFQFLVSREDFEEVMQNLPEDYDVVMLSYNLFKSNPYNERFGRAIDVQTASGYIVHSRFYDTLIDTLEEGYNLFVEHPGHHWLYINDQYWKKLQPVSRWYYSLVRVGQQCPGYSDLAQRVVEYGV
jgi:hypothetical protein